MLIIEAGRQQGKTEYLVEWVKEKPGRVIVTINRVERDRLIREYHLAENQVHVYTSNMPRTRGAEVAIDNLDLILDQVYGNVRLVTTTTT